MREAVKCAENPSEEVLILDSRHLTTDFSELRRGNERASVFTTNVASLRRKPFKQQGLASACQQCYQTTQDSPVYRVGYESLQGHRFPDLFEVE